MNEYIQSEKKFNELKKNNILSTIIQKIKHPWIEPEWEFPKGRRNKHETDIDCANREFKEETNFTNKDFEFLFCKNIIIPLQEVFIGTNRVRYKHNYFISISLSNKKLSIKKENKNQSNEISDIKWFTYDEALLIIRHYSKEKIKLLTNLHQQIISLFS